MDAKGWIFYRFDEDSAKPSNSNCIDDSICCCDHGVANLGQRDIDTIMRLCTKIGRAIRVGSDAVHTSILRKDNWTAATRL